MKKKYSKFKTTEGVAWLKDWHKRIMEYAILDYQAVEIDTGYGKTHVWAKNHEQQDKPALVFLPGFRTSGIYWDLNKTLLPFYDKYRIYLVDIIGQPSLSSGQTPPVKSDGYGHWLVEILDYLNLDKVLVSGASFGGQLMVKLALVAPKRVLGLVGFNPVGIQYINMGLRSMWYNILHMLFPSAKNIRLYIEKMVLDPALKIDPKAHELLLEYQQYVVKHFKFGCDYPYKFSDAELQKIEVPFYLIQCKNDNLISAIKTAKRAEEQIPNFKRAVQLTNIGHGIEVAQEPYVEFARILDEVFGKKNKTTLTAV